ncbi:hypothetical protein E3N88_06182 [Mikania micrantha]|uniref:SANT domain-containing protein n=1 Tax=Mikania micrantha TaxID=192012 RepID=A0A5N6PP68_9ASTR|nr:hypothetical protein E3N88_06182 [Mikania micrantha]
MDLDLDDLFSTDAANTAKAGVKFQPKGKSKPKPKPKPNAQLEPKSTPSPSTQVIEVAATAVEQTGNDVNQIIGNILDSLQSSFEKSQEEHAESFLTLDSPNDLLSESTISVNLPPHSMTQNIDASMDGKLEAGPTNPELVDNINASTNLESNAELDPLTGEGAAILNDKEHFQIGNLSPGSKLVALFWYNIGPRAGKFKPKPKPKSKPQVQSRKMDQIPNNPDQDEGPVQNGEDICLVPSQPDFMENEPTPLFTPDVGTSSIRITDSVPTETVSDYYVNEDANKALQLRDEGENEDVDDNNNDDEYVPENESLIGKKESKSKRKSKKPIDENKKLVGKRKKIKEVLDEITEVSKKKFKHSTRRNKRQVNPELLKIPEDEFELHMHSFPLKDLIRLREHKEKIEVHINFYSINRVDLPENTTHYNYHTHMKITRRTKWTKLDTELFYQAIQQFGTDLSLIRECFPGRTREQIRSKFKRESKLHRLRMESALDTRANDYSHFEFVIERLKQARPEDFENDNTITSADEEEEVVLAENNEDGNVELEKEVKDMKPDAPAAAGAESPTKGCDSPRFLVKVLQRVFSFACCDGRGNGELEDDNAGKFVWQLVGVVVTGGCEVKSVDGYQNDD